MLCLSLSPLLRTSMAAVCLMMAAGVKKISSREKSHLRMEAALGNCAENAVIEKTKIAVDVFTLLFLKSKIHRVLSNSSTTVRKHIRQKSNTSKVPDRNPPPAQA